MFKPYMYIFSNKAENDSRAKRKREENIAFIRVYKNHMSAAIKGMGTPSAPPRIR